MNRKRLYVIDGMSHIYRAFYAIRNLHNSEGLPTNAIFGFTSMLRKLIHDERPDYIGVAMDLEGPTVRHEKYEGYKATRKPMPEDLVPQLSYIRRVCDVFRVPLISYQGYEADDVIGTLSRMAAEQGLAVIIVTSDKDMLQLVSDHVLVLDPRKENLLVDAEKVKERLGVEPGQVPDLLGLWGDASDNIPGAPGIGEKGAKELINTFGTLEGCLQNWEKVKKKTYQKSLKENQEIIRTSLDLATIFRDLPLELNLEELATREPDGKAALALFSELEFNSLVKEFAGEAERKPITGQWLTGNALDGFLEDLRRQSTVYFCLSYSQGPHGHLRAKSACAMGESGTAGLFDLTDDGVVRNWVRLMQDPDIRKVCWDAKLSRHAQAHLNVGPDSVVDDAMLMAFLVAPHVGDYSLKRWALDRLYLTLPEVEVEGRDLLSGSDRTDRTEALCLTLEATRRLYEELSPKLEARGLGKVYREIELPFLPALADMESAGIKVSRQTLEKLSSEMQARLADLTGRIHEAACTEFNINSPKQLGEVLFERLNLPTLKKTRKTKSYSTDRAVLEELARSYEIPRLILDYRRYAKLKSTYADALPALIDPGTGRIHTTYHQTGAATGRISSSDPNLQNIPVRTELGRRIREAFVADEGHLLISADYSQIELRVLAHLSEDEMLLEAFQKNEDIHERTAREIFSEEERSNKSECRRMAKVINFGIVYGLSAFGLAQRLGIDREQAQAFIDAYFERYQKVRHWLDETIEEARQNGQVRTLFGRIRPIPEIKAKDYQTRQFAERIAVNSPIQGTAADILKLAMIRVRKSLQDSNLSAKMLLQVHDELVIESPIPEVQQARELLRKGMEGAADLRIPLLVVLSVADNWKEMK